MRNAAANMLLVCLAAGAASAQFARAQEASSGFDLRATLTAQAAASNELTEAPRNGSPTVLGSRVIAYPTFKINNNWWITGALQLTTRPYYFTDFSTAGYGAKGVVLQSTLNYSRVSSHSSILVRVGEMSTAFGSFVLRYDDADNALADFPIDYGYYGPVSILGIAGAQVDATRGKFDARAQLANSSPANPRSVFARDQYGNWAGGAGYTIRQGFRVGVSGFRGPYLDRKSPYFFPGEAKPSSLPAHALGFDANWAHDHTSALGELHKFVFPYTVLPTYRESAGYGEVKQVLSPRWYAAGRFGFTSAKASGKVQHVEAAAGFRPNRFQLIKAGYEYEHYTTGAERNNNAFAFQYITTFHVAAGRN